MSVASLTLYTVDPSYVEEGLKQSQAMKELAEFVVPGDLARIYPAAYAQYKEAVGRTDWKRMLSIERYVQIRLRRRGEQ